MSERIEVTKWTILKLLKVYYYLFGRELNIIYKKTSEMLQTDYYTN